MLALLVAVVSLGMDWLRSPQIPSDWSSTSLQTQTGKTVYLQVMSQDKPLLSNFWATWCAICKFTSSGVNQLVQEGENVVTVALRYVNRASVKHWLRKKAIRCM